MLKTNTSKFLNIIWWYYLQSFSVTYINHLNMASLKENQGLYHGRYDSSMFINYFNVLWCMTSYTAETRKLKTTFSASPAVRAVNVI